VVHEDDGADDSVCVSYVFGKKIKSSLPPSLPPFLLRVLPSSDLGLALGEVGRVSNDVLGFGHLVAVTDAFRHALVKEGGREGGREGWIVNV